MIFSIFNWFRWPSGTKEQEAHNRKAIIGDFCVTATLTCAIWLWSHTLDPLPAASKPLHTSGLGAPWFRVFLFLLQVFVLYADVVLQPAPKKELDPERYNSISFPVGHACYFTVQTLILQTVYCFFSAFASITNDMRIAAAVNNLAVYTAMQGVMLTLLFLKLNWFEDKWRNTLRPQMEKALPGWSDLMLFTHIPALFIGLVDLFFVQKASTLASFGPTKWTVMIACLVYGLIVCGWMFLFLYDRAGVSLYPFVAKLTTFGSRAMFILVQGGGCCVMAALLDYARAYVGDGFL